MDRTRHGCLVDLAGRLRTVLVFALVALQTADLAAMQATAAGDEQITPELIQERIKQVQESNLDEAARQKVLDVYRQALSDLESAALMVATAAELDRDIQTAPAAIQQAKLDLSTFQERASAGIPGEASLAELQQQLSELETRIEAEKLDAADLADKVKRRAHRRAEIGQLRQTTRQELSDVEKKLAAMSSEDTSPLALAGRMQLRARRQALLQMIARYEREEARIQAEQDLVPLRRDLARRSVARTEQQIQLWREAVNQRRRSEQEEQARQAQYQLEMARAFQAYPAVKQLAEENAGLAELRDRSTKRITELTAEFDRIGGRLESLSRDFKQIQERVEAAGGRSVIGLLLRKQRAELPDAKKHRRNIEVRQSEVQDVQLAYYEMVDRRSELADVEACTDLLLSTLQPTPPEQHRARLRSFVRSLLETERELLDSLIAEYGVYAKRLADVEAEEQLLVDETEKFDRYIGEHVLWIRSTSAVRPTVLRDLGRAVVWLIQPAAWQAVLQTLVADAWPNLQVYLSVLTVLLILVWLQPRMRRRIREIGAMASRGTAAQFAPTARVVGLTALMSLLGPGLLWFLGWRLSIPLDAPAFAAAVAPALQILAMIYCPIEFFAQTCRHRGLAEAHFGWPESGVTLLRRNLRWLKMLGLPAALIAAMLHFQENERFHDSLGRLAFVTALLLSAEFMRRVLRPNRGALQETIAYSRGGWLDRLQSIWYPGGVAIPVALAVLAASGYQYTAEQLVIRLYGTLWLMLGLLVVGALFARWALVTRRKIAIDQMRQRREAALAADSSAAPSDVPDVHLQSGLDVSQMSTQARQLLRAVLASAAVVGLWFIWVDVLPALSVLKQVRIGEITLEHAEIPGLAQPDKGESALTRVEIVPITLADLILAVLLFVVTIIAARNLPGLLEMAVLQRLPLDGASRYAFATIARYVLTIIGIVAAFRVLGIGWQKVQWLAAAITLGLGFGLQEIFANFVSGLIILFERPVRVGDIVTVGDVSGLVTRIRMRATTITDWDRKEMLIPNKDLITGRVLNWTLSDAVTRVVVTVGVAYGTDTKRTTDLLLTIARSDPRILADPAPVVTFARFGDSTLEFELRCFLPSVEHRLPVTHDLHTAIHAEFAAAGIEIAFPQRDLHIRSFTPSVPIRQELPVIVQQPAQQDHALAGNGKRG